MNLPATGRSVTSSFVSMPEGVCFEHQQENESVYMLLRPHQITNLTWIVTTILFLIAPFIVGGFIIGFFPNFFASLNPSYVVVLYLFWNCVILMYAFCKYLIWFFSAYLITNNRLVDVDFLGLFNKEYTETLIDNVQDVTSEIKGPIQVVFNYGLVLVQTASEKAEIEFEDVPHPDIVTKVIGDLVREKGGILRHKETGI